MAAAASCVAGWLAEADRQAHAISLSAPTRFHATCVGTNLRDRLLRRVDPTVRDVEIIA